mmetsp:Transcript_39598/g.60574  ORF Transcript_39598/g.60574 Transcript_39598/m.60574 type:complete len:98 (+) Transcript_39598:230-523(+)
MPKVEFGSSAEVGEGPNDSDPFEEALEDALCVFKSGDTNSDILEKNAKLVMFYIDLENEVIVGTNSEEAKEPNQDNSYGEQGAETKHPMLFNQYPLC